MADFACVLDIFGVSFPLFLAIIIWSIIWKGLALWKSARKEHLIWFIILLVINTLGILEILYIFIFSEMKLEKKIGKVKKKK
jgi:methionyl-tRNA synthetase